MTVLSVQGRVDPLIVRDVGLGLGELVDRLDLSDLAEVRLSVDRGQPTAASSEPVSPGVWAVRVNDLLFDQFTDLNPTWKVGDPVQPGKDAPDYLGLHEDLHFKISPDNPAFAALLLYVRDGDQGPGVYFFGAEAMKVNGGPLLVDEFGHVLGPKYLGDVMSGSWPTYRDRPQVLSAIDLAVLHDVGVHERSGRSDLSDLYQATFARAPDAAGLAYWQGRMADGMTIGEVAQSFFAQPEAQALLRGDLVTQAYLNVLGREPDAAGAAYWKAELLSGEVKQGEFILDLIKGAVGADAEHLATVGHASLTVEYLP